MALLSMGAASAWAQGGQPAPAGPDIPGIGLGDFWDYRISGQDEGTVHNEVKRAESKTSDYGQAYDTYRIYSSGEVDSRQTDAPTRLHIEFEVDKWVRRSDYAVVQLEGVTRIYDSPLLPTPGEETETLEAFDPPLVEAIFPFQVDYRWRSVADWHLERGGEEPVDDRAELHATVLRQENVTVPAGRFEAWVIEYNSYKLRGSTYIQWFAPAACDIVKEERYNNEGDLVNRLVLTDYHCSHVAKANPKYDPGSVTLLDAGEAFPPVPVDPDDPQTHTGAAENADNPWLWPSLLAVIAVALILVAARRQWVRK